MLIQQGHREDTIMAVVLIPLKPRCSKKIQHPARWPAALWRPGGVASRRPSHSWYIYRAAKINIAIGQDDLAIRLYDAVPGAQGRPEATDALAGWEYTLGFIMS